MNAFRMPKGCFCDGGFFFWMPMLSFLGRGDVFVGAQVILGDRRNVGAQELVELIKHVQRKIFLGKVYVQQTD